jgi:hypothetical protein
MIVLAQVGWAQEAVDDLRDGELERVEAAGHSVSVLREGPRLTLVAGDESGARVLVPSGGDRVALSPDGAQVAYVAPRDGVTTVWVVPFAGGPSRPVTPAVVRVPGRAPEGFVAPPRDRSLRFEGDALCWHAPAGGPDTCVGWR